MAESIAMSSIPARAVELARKKGAGEASASASLSREVEVGWRDGKVEKLSEATSRGLELQVYVDGHYAAVSTSDLRPEALDPFVEEAVALARAIAKDPFRALPDPELYKGRAELDLQLEDPSYPELTADRRRALAAELEQAARSAPGAERLVSVSTEVSDSRSESYRVASNGFEGSARRTLFVLSAQATVKDDDGRRPAEYDHAAARRMADLPGAASVGEAAAQRALARLGAKKGASERLPVVVDSRASGKLVSTLLGPLSAGALQQKKSMFEGKLGASIGGALLDIADDPHLIKGLGSQLFDGEGIAARRFPVFEAGALRSYYVDNYYGRKLAMRPTTARPSNLTFKLGDKDCAGLMAAMGEGILVTRFLGGNSNGTTGDFSFGFQGFRVRGGALAEPLAEMNLSGNHLAFWKTLAAVGNDPYPYSSMRTPSLLFEGAQVAGT